MSFLSRKSFMVILLFPATFLFLGYVILPLFVAFSYSLTNYQGLGEKAFIGLRNYAFLFRTDTMFPIALKNTAIIMVMTLVLIIPFSFLLASIVNRRHRGSEVLKVIYFAPNIISGIIVGVIWVFILDPTIGLLNNVLGSLGLEFLALEWIGGTVLTPYSVSVVHLWTGSGFIMMIILAGMKMIPEEQYQAAAVDGASSLQQTWYVTLPMLRETFITCTILTITTSIKTFETVYMLTGGGPNHFSEVIVSMMYNTTFISHKYGYGMAIAVVEFFLAMLVSVVSLRTMSRRRDD